MTFGLSDVFFKKVFKLKGWEILCFHWSKVFVDGERAIASFLLVNGRIFEPHLRHGGLTQSKTNVTIEIALKNRAHSSPESKIGVENWTSSTGHQTVHQTGRPVLDAKLYTLGLVSLSLTSLMSSKVYLSLSSLVSSTQRSRCYGVNCGVNRAFSAPNRGSVVSSHRGLRPGET